MTPIVLEPVVPDGPWGLLRVEGSPGGSGRKGFLRLIPCNFCSHRKVTLW